VRVDFSLKKLRRATRGGIAECPSPFKYATDHTNAVLTKRHENICRQLNYIYCRKFTVIFHVIFHTLCISETLYTHRLTTPERDEIQLEILDSANNVSFTNSLIYEQENKSE